MQINNEDVKIENIKEIPHYTYFACTCKQEDGKYWQQEMENFLDGGDRRFAVTAMMYTLEYDYSSYITGIDVDIWCGVSIKNQNASIYVQCDMIEYGILAAIKILEQIHAEGNINE